jgi:hypothetical protein
MPSKSGRRSTEVTINLTPREGDKLIKLTITLTYPFKPEDYREYGGYGQFVQLASTIEQAAGHDFQMINDGDTELLEMIEGAREGDSDTDFDMMMQVVSYNDEGDETIHYTVQVDDPYGIDQEEKDNA